MKNTNHIPNNHRSQALSGATPEEKAKLGEIWDLVEHAEDTPKFSTHGIAETWQQLSNFARVNEQPPAADNARPALRLVERKKIWMSIAATILIGAIGLSWWTRPLEIHAPRGQRIAVNLPDGSNIILNSGSTLTRPRRFNSERRVYLEGEAFFDIATAKVPFRVSTYNAQIEVLGTQFNVKSWEKSIAAKTSVTLTEGRVSLAPLGGTASSIVMTPGQTREVLRSNNAVTAADTLISADVMAWREGHLIFRNEPVGVILEEIARRFATDIELHEDLLKEKEITFVFRKPDFPEDVIESLCDALGVQFSKTANGYEIY